MNAKTGVVLFEKNAHRQAFPASTTKIATAIYALNQCGSDLERKMTATSECIASISPQAKRQSNYRSPSFWLESDGTHIGIRAGEEFRFFDLLCAMMISSANDASNVIALNVGGTIPTFMGNVNHYLKEIGCHDTVFNNPHGLHHPQHFTTAYDLAVMAKVGLNNPIFRKIVSMSRYECPQTNLQYGRTFLQTNMLLRNGSLSYSKALGVKTGTTQAAGKNLVAAAEEDGRCLIAVALGYKGNRSELYQDVIKMFETAFQETKMRRCLIKKGITDLSTSVKGAKGQLVTHLPDGLFYDFYPAEECPVKARVIWEIPPLPIKAGAPVGKIYIIDDRGEQIKETGLYAFEDLKPSLWYRVMHPQRKGGRKLLFLSGVSAIFLSLWKKRRKRHIN